jgi:hypothetical protein
MSKYRIAPQMWWSFLCSKLFMHASSWNMFPTTRNLQISVHVYCSRHCCDDMKQTDSSIIIVRNVCVLTSASMIVYLFLLFMHVSSRNMFPTIRNLQIRVHVYRPRHCCGEYSNANDMRVTQDLNSFGEIIAHAHCSVDGKK